MSVHSHSSISAGTEEDPFDEIVHHLALDLEVRDEGYDLDEFDDGVSDVAVVAGHREHLPAEEATPRVAGTKTATGWRRLCGGR